MILLSQLVNLNKLDEFQMRNKFEYYKFYGAGVIEILLYFLVIIDILLYSGVSLHGVNVNYCPPYSF